LKKFSATANRGTRQRGNNPCSSVIIAAERRGHSVRQILEQVKAVQDEIEIGVSVVTIAELVHGAYRTKNQAQQRRRLEFIERLSSDVRVHPVTLAIARLAGRIEGQQEAIGVQFAFENLLIGATALHLDYEGATLNLRDFRRIPGLSVIRP
jgi:predicted nucleic acid-binding protein